jgi:hypothetical protein
MKQLMLTVGVLIAVTGGAYAQSADSPATKIMLARRLYDEGVEAAGKGQWSIAYDRFKTSYDVTPRVLTLYNLACAQAHTGRLVEAIENYRRFLRDTGDGRYPELRTDATSQLELLRTEIAQVTLVVANLERDDVITIDDIELPQTALRESIPLNPGSHVARLHRGALVLVTRKFTLVSGASEEAHIELPGLAEPPVPSVPPLSPPGLPPAPAAPASSRSWLRSPWLWSGIAAVVAGTVAGAFLVTRSPEGVVVH